VRDLVRAVLVMFAGLTLVTGVAYPLLITAAAQAAFPFQANGSLIVREGTLQGSTLIGQPFDDPKDFWGRPSATTAQPYNAGASSGSNLGPTNPALTDVVRARIAALRAADPGNFAPIPVDLVTASASGLDPDITPAAAFYQVARVARSRGMDQTQVRDLVTAYTTKRTFGILGERRVNVVLLNMALDER
jgi:potassium-transporting ATPase KdpC subunit